MQNAGPIARRAAADARTPEVLSVRETGGNNRGKYVETYLKAAGASPGDPWCAALQFYRLLVAAKELGLKLPSDFDPRAYTPDWKNYALRNKLWIPVQTAQEAPLHTLQTGDMALFYFSNLGRIGHIEVVEEVHDWGCLTVGGNTGPDKGATVERAGDGVYLKKRTWSQLGARGGYARLPF